MQLSNSIVSSAPAAIATVPAGGQAVALQTYQPAAAAPLTTLIPVQMVTPPAPPAQESLISIAEVIDYLRAYWKRGVLVAGPLALFAFIYLGFGTPVYEAESKLKINLQDSQLLAIAGQAPSGFSELSAPMIINNHRTGLKSRRFVDFFYTKLTPSERAAFLGDTGRLGLKSRLLLALGLSGPPKATPPEELFAAKIDKAVRIEPVKESHILRIQIRDSDGQRCAELANQYVHYYIDYVSEDALSGMKSALETLQVESADLRDKLETKQREAAEFRRSANILSDTQTGEVNAQRAASLAKAVTEAEVDLIKASIDLNEMRRAQASGDPASVKGMGSDTQIIELRKQMDEVNTKRSNMLEWCGRNHPKIIAFDNELRRMNDALMSRVGELVSAAEAEEARLRNQHEQLRRQLAEVRGEVFEEDPKYLTNNFLSDEARAERELYNQVLDRMKRTALATKIKDTSQLTVADVAVPPEGPVSPRKSIAMLAGMMVFGLVGLAIPIGSGLWKDHVLPLLSQVRTKAASVPEPHADEASHAQNHAQSQAVAQVFTEAAPQPTAAWGGVSYQQAAAAAAPPYDPTPFTAPPAAAPASTPQTQIIATIPELMAAEGPIQLGELLHPGVSGDGAIAQLAAILSRHQTARSGPGIVLITSASTSEGKSLLASALAASLCTSGQRVFLMECNPASPSIQNWFPQAGSYSSWTNDLETLRYGASNLFLLPAHDLPSYEVSDLLDGYRAWMSKAQHDVDWIVLDGASLLRGFADVAQLAPMATDILFVHDETRTGSEQVRAALNLLRPLVRNESLRGMVINRHG